MIRQETNVQHFFSFIFNPNSGRNIVIIPYIK